MSYFLAGRCPFSGPLSHVYAPDISNVYDTHLLRPMRRVTGEVTIVAVTSKWLSASQIGEEFDRAFNEVFEDLLITRWRAPRRVRNFGKALVVEDEEIYRVRIALPDADPRKLEVEVSEWRLAVRSPTAQGRAESTVLDFSHRVDTERVTARFEAGILEVRAPKARARKIDVR